MPPLRAFKHNRTRGGDNSLTFGSRVSDSSSEDLGSGDEVSDDDESLSAKQLYSSSTQRLSGALDVLLEVAPSLFSGGEDSTHVGEVSAVEEVLGCAYNAQALPELLESKVVASELQAAFRSVAGLSSSAGRGGPSPFLSPVKPWFQRAKFLRFRREVLPRTSSIVSQPEKELIPVKEGSPAVFLSDRVLASWESQLVHSLSNLSLADSLLSGVGKVLIPSPDAEGPGSSVLAGENELRQDDLFLLLSSLGQCVSSLAAGLSCSYTNVVLARRDALLGKAILPYQVRHSLRVLPRSDSLFGPQVSDLVHQASERARDSAVFKPQRAHSTFDQGTKAGRGKKRRFGGRGGGSPQRKRAKQSFNQNKDADPTRKSSGRGRSKPFPPQ